tara:strand:+ start:7764 stop:8210 length:447 start_codon:yes stop_codon:yes gene_type:complete
MSVEFGKDTPFVLIARIQVKTDYVDEYLRLAKTTDKLVRQTESGMLHHTFDSDPYSYEKFVWTEVYANDDAFINHMNNPDVKTYLAKHIDLADNLEIEIFGTVRDSVIERLGTLDCHVKYYLTHCGFSRCQQENIIVRFFKKLFNYGS